ncbi:MAG: AEC family transporter, partial [Lachnospiraceae bacterium]|nr:AEC family transporter [Lachnospiraceae bacterium]
MSLSVILQQMGVICILVAIGIFLEKRGKVSSLTSKQISAIVVDICNPALILASILSGDITATHKDLLIGAGLGAAFYALLVVLGFLFPHLLRVPKDERRFYHLMVVYTNTGFLGIPVARAVLPANSILYVIVINVFYSLFFYTHGLAILGNGKSGEKRRFSPLMLLNPGILMALAALAVFWFDVTLPPILANTAIYVGNATVFLSMMLLGINIARSSLTSHLRNARIWAYIVLRMILLPVGIAVLMNALSFDPAATLAMVLMAAVP